MSAAKHATLRDLGPRWALPPAGPGLGRTLDACFDGDGPLLIDIGVGDGEATRAWASARPEARVLAFELHRPGLVKLLDALDAHGPPNVRVAEADALDALAHLEPASVRAVRVLFPDPWPKRRHVARRLVDRAFATRVAALLEPGGTLEVATDWADYARHARTMVAAVGELVPVVDPGHDPTPGDPRGGDDHHAWRSARPNRPVTAYERRGLDAGRPIIDLVWVRRSDR